MKRRKRSRLLLVSWLVLLAGLAAEGALRLREAWQEQPLDEQAMASWSGMLVADDDPVLRYRNAPGVQRTIHDVAYVHDERGRRVLNGPWAQGARRVAFLGDSTIYGLGVAAEDTVPWLTARELSFAIEPLDLGVSGYGSEQELALYERERQQLPGCDLVVLSVYPNDFQPISYFWDAADAELYYDPLPLPRALTARLRHSALYRALVYLATPEALRDDPAADPVPRDIDHVERALQRLSRLVTEDGRRLLVVNLPAMDRLDPYRHEHPVAQVQAICRRLQLPCVDLLPGFLEERERLQQQRLQRSGRMPSAEQRAWFLARYWLRYGEDSHLDPQANRIVARQLAAALAPLLGS